MCLSVINIDHPRCRWTSICALIECVYIRRFSIYIFVCKFCTSPNRLWNVHLACGILVLLSFRNSFSISCRFEAQCLCPRRRHFLSLLEPLSSCSLLRIAFYKIGIHFSRCVLITYADATLLSSETSNHILNRTWPLSEWLTCAFWGGIKQ